MNTRILKEIISLIRIEQERRSSVLRAEDQDYANDHWLFWDEPFLNVLCLMFLVTLRHQVEREVTADSPKNKPNLELERNNQEIGSKSL
jgi:hypothetical protein